MKIRLIIYFILLIWIKRCNYNFIVIVGITNSIKKNIFLVAIKTDEME
jgi:hypothetical protein